MQKNLFQEESSPLLAEIKTTLLDRNIAEKDRELFMQESLPKLFPNFDWENFYYYGSRQSGTIILVFRPTQAQFDVSMERLNDLYMECLRGASKVINSPFFGGVMIGTTYELAKNLETQKSIHGKKNITLIKLMEWFRKNYLRNSVIKKTEHFISIKCTFDPPFSKNGKYTKNFYVPNNFNLSEVGSFLYSKDRLPTRAEAMKFARTKDEASKLFHEKNEREKYLEERA